MSQRDVKPQTVLKQIDLLIDIADLLIKAADICLPLLDAIIADAPFISGKQPQQKLHHSGFSAAALAADGIFSTRHKGKIPLG